MVQNPYGEDASSIDPRRLKLQLQAQEQFINQLQQRIAKQSVKIEELQQQIQQLQHIIAKKDAELEQYSKRLEEERKYWDEDKKARANREHELMKKIKEKELEIRKLESIIDKLQRKETYETIKVPPTNKQEKLINVLLAYFKKPTDENFVKALKDLIQFASTEGTTEQKILGLLSKAELPLKVDEMANKLGLDAHTIKIALQGLERDNLIKRVGKGYTVISSEFISQSPAEVDWSTSSAKEIFDQLHSMVYIAENNEELVTAFTKARDRLMELGVLSPLTRHAISQQINRIKSGNYDPAELQKLITTWKEQIK